MYYVLIPIKESDTKLLFMQREIGEYLGLHPGYVSRIVLKLRKG